MVFTRGGCYAKQPAGSILPRDTAAPQPPLPHRRITSSSGTEHWDTGGRRRLMNEEEVASAQGCKMVREREKSNMHVWSFFFFLPSQPGQMGL